MIYLHDGYFDGFLTCIYDHYYSQKATGIFPKEQYQLNMFETTREIVTDEVKAKKVHDCLLNQFSEDIYWYIFYTFLSDDYYKDCYLLKYMELAFKLGNSIYKLHSHEATYPVKRISRCVMGERHRFLGLLRFSEVSNCLYAAFEPDNDILISIADHFADRLKQERFIIHDIKRKKAVICNEGKWFITDFELNQKILPTEKELLIQDLWKCYFDSVGINERANKKLQQSFVPLKYRKHLLEFNNSYFNK